MGDSEGQFHGLLAEYDYRANQGYADIGIRLITLVPKEETRSGT